MGDKINILLGIWKEVNRGINMEFLSNASAMNSFFLNESVPMVYNPNISSKIYGKRYINYQEPFGKKKIK